MISLSHKPHSGPCRDWRRGLFSSVTSMASHSIFTALQKSSKSQNISTSRSNICASTCRFQIGSLEALLIHKRLIADHPVAGVNYEPQTGRGLDVSLPGFL